MLRKLMFALALAVVGVVGGFVAVTVAQAFVPGFQLPHLYITYSPPHTGQRVENGQHVFWYFTRATGLAAYLVLFVNMALGIMVKTKVWDNLVARWQSFDLHQFTALLGLGFLGVHLLTLMLDSYIGYTPLQLLVPFTTDYRPLPVSLGVVGMYMMVAVGASVLVRNRIGYKAWRSLHYLSFFSYLAALMHGVFAGTDTATPWAQGMYVGTVFVLVALTVWRFMEASDKPVKRAPAVAEAQRPVSR